MQPTTPGGALAAPAGFSPANIPPPLSAVLLRALLYALAVAVLVVFAPAREHVFIYQGF